MANKEGYKLIAPAKIIIEGDYWDCQIYRGRLYLWTFNGDLSVYNWDELVNSIICNENEILATTCAFTRGDYLYNPDFNLFFGNNDIRGILSKQFNYLSKRNIVIEKQRLIKFLVSAQEIPTKELPTDTDIFNNKIISADQTGLYRYTIHKSYLKNAASTKPEKLWDCPLLSIKAGNRGNIAMSAGSDGLFEFMNFDYYGITNKPNECIEQISSKHSSFSSWAYSCIYSTSVVNESFLAPFYYSHDANSIFDNNYNEKPTFVSKKIISDTAIFGKTGGISWANNEKFYHYEQNKLSIVNFIQKNLQETLDSAFVNKMEIPLNEWRGDVISSGVAYFGTIIECENAMFILLSDGRTLTLPGSVVKWRVYPRSIRYENHLHLVKTDCIEIYSFNHDYYINQFCKQYGIAYRTKNTNWTNYQKPIVRAGGADKKLDTS